MKQNDRRGASEKGFTMVLALVAVLILFTTISLIKISTLEGINPDLQRIGINTGDSQNVQPIAEAPIENSGSTLPDPNATPNPENNLEIASSGIEGDAEDMNEGDNPSYIE